MYNFNFNSIKVRLERFPPYLRAAIVPFQFHKGTIRTFLVVAMHEERIISIP